MFNDILILDLFYKSHLTNQLKIGRKYLYGKLLYASGRPLQEGEVCNCTAQAAPNPAPAAPNPAPAAPTPTPVAPNPVTPPPAAPTPAPAPAPAPVQAAPSQSSRWNQTGLWKFGYSVENCLEKPGRSRFCSCKKRELACRIDFNCRTGTFQRIICFDKLRCRTWT